MGLLSGRTLLVTGAHAGVGRAVVEAALAAGGRVMLHARLESDMAAACAALEAQHGDAVAGAAGDLLDPETPARLVAEAVTAFGGLDALVNNAALLDRSSIEDATAAHIDAMLAVNVRAPLLLIQAAVPHLRARRPGGGSVVNIGSINAHCGAPNLLAYSASKAALMTATRNLADAVPDLAVRFNQINLGWTLTENERALQRREGRPDDWAETVPKAFAPRGEILKPSEAAAHVVFWLSDASAPASGQVYELEQYPLIGRNRISTR